MNSIRRETIRKFVEEHEVVTVEQLCQLLPEVSLMTVHRDLNYLQDHGYLVKVRGGARYVDNRSSEPVYSAREMANREAKLRMAKKAQQFLPGARSIFIDAGTTMMAFAEGFPNIRANVVSTGPNVAIALAKQSLLRLHLCGGEMNKNNLALSGSAAIDSLSAINIDTAFLVSSGYDAACGFSCGMESEAQVKQIVAQKARTKILLMDSSKCGRVFPYTFAQMADIDVFISELEPAQLPADMLEAAAAHSVQIV